MQQQQLLRRRVALMSRTVTTAMPGPVSSGPVVSASVSGGMPVAGAAGMGGQAAIMPGPGTAMSPSAVPVPSPVSGMGGGMTSPHPHQGGMGMKGGGHSPSPNVLQVVKQVQEEAARQQVPHGGGFGKGGPMAPPVMQRHMGVVPNMPNAGGMVGNVNVGGVGQMGPGGNAVMGNNLLPMDQWGGGNRYQNNANPGMRQPNQNQVMQQNAMQQQVR